MPLLVAYQNASFPIPLGATTPSPVMTTRRWRECAMLFLPLQLPVKPARMGENEYAIDPAKAARMGQGDIECCITRDVWHIIQVTARVSKLLIDRWRQHLLLQCQRSDDGFDGAGRSLAMPDHRFGRANGDVIGVCAKDRLVCCRLCYLIGQRRTAMRVNVAHLFSSNSALCQRLSQEVLQWHAIIGQGSHMVGVAIGGKGDNFGIDMCAACYSYFALFQQ